MDTALPVLIVDDSKPTAFIVRRLLRECGFAEFDFALNGLTAFAQMRRRRFGLILADVDMHPMNGLDLLKQVRADCELRHTCFVLMSAFKDAGNVVAARQFDADAFMLKPFGAKHLAEKLAPLRRLRSKLGVLVS